MKRKSVLSAVSLTIVLACTSVALADDDAIFNANNIQPNVVILVDTSGSMDDPPSGWWGTSKLTLAKNVLVDLVQSVSGIRYTIFEFNDSSDGAHLVTPVGTAVATMVTEINAMDATGSTPLGRASQDVADYFKGNFSEGGSYAYGCGSSRGWYGRWHSGWGYCPVVSYPSPIQYTCQKNYFIIVTDGMPNGESTTLVTDVARSLYTTDQSSSLAGVQNVITYTVGFDNTSGVSLLTSTAAAGGGQFFSASDGDELEAALRDVLSQVIEDSYRFVTPLIPSSSSSGASVAYLASLKPNAKSFWKGDLKAYQLNSSGLVPVDSSNMPLDSAVLWDAGTLLNAKLAANRTIYTELSNSLVAFSTSNSNINAGLLGVSGSTDANNLINYVRGRDTYDEDRDGTTAEERAWKLGDIYHSAPVLVFAPPLNSTDSTYNTFKTANASRTQVVLVGANDGMLHAFRASDGQELWAFIPDDLVNQLQHMKPTNTTHDYYVDGSPVVADVKISGTWKTIVVFGERRGGPSFQALDVTDPTSPSYLWKFTDSKMTESWSDPTIGKVKMADGTDKYVAFVGAGYDTASNNAHGKAVYAIDLSNGSMLWQYYNTGANDASKMNFSIPASPAAVDINGDGYVDRLYVGDIGGQLWKFDLSSPATLSSGLVNNWTGKIVFKAAPAATNPPASGEYYPTQAMYGRPAVALDTNGNVWVEVGTGDRNHPNQSSSNRFYGILDNTNMTNNSALTESNLVAAPSTNNTITQGWYLALASNEKVFTGAQIHNGIAYFTSYTPNTTPSCDTSSGTSLAYAVQMTRGDAAINWSDGSSLTGENSSTRYIAAGGGIGSTPRVVPGATNDTIVISASDGQVITIQRPTSASKQIRYWREVY